MILTQAYSRVANAVIRAWMISPEGELVQCGQAHEECEESHPDLFRDRSPWELLKEGWGQVGYFGFADTCYLNVQVLTESVFRTFAKLVSTLKAGSKFRVEIITPGDTAVFSLEDFQWFDSLADMKKFNRSGRFAAAKPTRAWMVSPQGKIHDCGRSHEKYIKKNAKEFGGVDHPWDLMDQGWTRVGVLDKELYINPGQQLTASLLDLLQTFAMKVQVPYDKVEVGVPAGYVYFTKQEFPTISLKDINRRGPITYSSRWAAIYDDDGIRPPGRETYLDIGHRTDRESFLLWLWKHGEILVSRVFEKGEKGYRVYHDHFWPNDLMNAFYGRFEPETGELSAVIPERWQHRPLPEILLESLERKFHPKNIHVH